MKEFNFKMLHGILSCGANLHKWKIRNSSVCDVCDQDQTIIHLLFECKHVERLWTSVGEALGMNNTQDSIMCGCMDGNFYGNNIIITLVCFLIYKDWLVRSLDNKKRSVDFNLELLKCELKLRMDIYEKCNMIVHVNQIVNLLSYLCQ